MDSVGKQNTESKNIEAEIEELDKSPTLKTFEKPVVKNEFMEVMSNNSINEQND